MGCGFSRERKNSASERSYLRRRSSAAACLSVFSGCLLFLLRHPRTASGIPAPVCSVRFAFSNASRPCASDRPQAPAFRPADRASRLHRHPLRPRHPSALSDSLFRKPPGPAAPIDRKRLSCGPRIVPSACTAALFGPGTPEPLPVSRHPSAPSGTGRTRKAPTLREECRGIRRSGRSAHPCGPWHGYSAPRIVPPACTATLFGPGTPEPLPVSRHPSALSDSLFRKPPGPAAPIDRKRLSCGPRIVPPACTAALFAPGTPEPLSVSRRPSAPSGSLFRMPPGPAAPIDRKRLLSAPRIGSSVCTAALFCSGTPNRFRYPGARLFRPVRFSGSLPALRPRSAASACFPACESCLPPAPPLSSAPAPRTASGIPAPVCFVRFAFSEASRPCGPDRPQAPFSGLRIVPPVCTAALFAPGARLFRPEQDGRERLRPSGKKCRGIRRSGRSAHPCGPRHGYSAPPVADGAFSVHRCFSISTNHSGQRHGRRVSLRMNPSTVDPVLSSSPRSFRIS